MIALLANNFESLVIVNDHDAFAMPLTGNKEAFIPVSVCIYFYAFAMLEAILPLANVRASSLIRHFAAAMHFVF